MDGTNVIDGLGGINEKVRISESADLPHAQISVEEGFILSRIDGVSSIKTICLISGLGTARTIEILRHLHEVGLILVGAEKPRPRTAPKAPPRVVRKTEERPAVQVGRTEPREGTSASTARTPDPKIQTSVPKAQVPEGSEAAEPGAKEEPGRDFGAGVVLPLGEEDLEINPELRKRIRGFHSIIETLDDFEILGVSSLADSKTLRRAYFKRSKEFHPDRFFQKRTGPYREMVHVLFKRIAAAYQNLEDEERRRAYAARLQAMKDRSVAPTKRPDPEEAAAAAERSAREATLRARDTAERTRIKAEHLQKIEERKHKNRSGPAVAEEKPMRARRSAEASPAPSSTVETNPFMGKAREYFDQGGRQYESGELQAAVTNFRLAVTLDPENPEFHRAHEEASERLKVVDAEQTYARAEEEELAGRVEAASTLFIRAADLSPRLPFLLRAAEAVLRAGDLIRAGDYATKIARNYPNSAGAHLFLARIYEASGLMSDALEEVKKSLEIDAGNGEAKAILKRLTPRP